MITERLESGASPLEDIIRFLKASLGSRRERTSLSCRRIPQLYHNGLKDLQNYLNLNNYNEINSRVKLYSLQLMASIDFIVAVQYMIYFFMYTHTHIYIYI